MAAAPRIVVAEDEPRIAAFLQKGLRAHGYATALAVTPREAVNLAASGRFALLVLDLRPEGTAPAAVLAALEPLGSPLPVVLLTTARPASLPPGVAHVLRKPFRFDELLAAVREAGPRGAFVGGLPPPLRGP